MALDPSATQPPGTKWACLLLALSIGNVWSAAPTQQVSNLRFEDTNSDGGWLSGTIRWDPPANTDGIHNYGVLIFNQMSDISPSLPALPGSFAGGWYLCDLGGVPHALVGTNELTIGTLFKESLNFPRRGSIEVQPESRRRYSWGHLHPPDRYLAVACINADKEGGLPVVIPIYDKSPHFPIEHLDNLNFVDTNVDLGVLSGKISWVPGKEADFTLTQTYSVHLAKDAVGLDDVQIGETNVPTFELTLSDLSRYSRDFVHIRAVNTHGISGWSKYMRLFDLGPSAPTQGVTALAFTDTDFAQGTVAGTISWTPPDDEGPISSYRIFLSISQGVGGILQPSGGYQVAVGTNEFVLPTYTVRNMAGGSQGIDFIQVYSENDKGMQSVPSELGIEDRSDD